MILKIVKNSIPNNNIYLFTTLIENKYILLMPNYGYYGYKNFLIYYEKNYEENKNIVHLKVSDDLEYAKSINSIELIVTAILKCNIFKNLDKIIFYFMDNTSKITNRFFDLKKRKLSDEEEKNDVYEKFTKIIY